MLAEVEAFRAVPETARRRLEAGARIMPVRDGTRIFAQGDAADAVYAIIGGEGTVRIGAGDDNSKQLMVQVFRTGEIFGEVGVLDGATRTADAVAEGSLRLARIGAAAFLEALSSAPELGLNLCRILALRLRRTSALLRDATFETLEVRLARQLLYLADQHGRRVEGGLRLTGHFRQHDLADLLGATPRSIITILNAWRAGKLVQYDTARGLLTLSNEAALRRLIHEEAR
ncbi:MAG TPA: Crp/Fnr family transcriptional regulator [Acetobacteraceae bacterium]